MTDRGFIRLHHQPHSSFEFFESVEVIATWWAWRKRNEKLLQFGVREAILHSRILRRPEAAGGMSLEPIVFPIMYM